MNKAIEHLPVLREKLSAIDDNYLDIQQDILESSSTAASFNGSPSPPSPPLANASGLKLDNPRQLALMHALVRFAQIAAASTFSTNEIYPHVVAALGDGVEIYSLASLRYDLSKLASKASSRNLPRSRRYQLPPEGYSVCLIFLKLFDRLCAPSPPVSSIRPRDTTARQKRSLLDRLYQRLSTALDQLIRAIGLTSPSINENKIPVGAPITA